MQGAQVLMVRKAGARSYAGKGSWSGTPAAGCLRETEAAGYARPFTLLSTAEGRAWACSLQMLLSTKTVITGLDVCLVTVQLYLQAQRAVFSALSDGLHKCISGYLIISCYLTWAAISNNLLRQLPRSQIRSGHSSNKYQSFLKFLCNRILCTWLFISLCILHIWRFR